jgi:hypothetical protein
MLTIFKKLMDPQSFSPSPVGRCSLTLSPYQVIRWNQLDMIEYIKTSNEYAFSFVPDKSVKPSPVLILPDTPELSKTIKWNNQNCLCKFS